MIQFKTKTLPSEKGNIQHQLRILTSVTLLIPFCLANPVAAFSAVPTRQLTGVQEVATTPILIADADGKKPSSSAVDFTILFPGTPTKKTEKKNGNTYYTATLGNDEGFYLLSYLELPKNLNLSEIPDESKKILLNTMVDLFVQKESGFKLQAKRSISLNNHPGEEFDFLYMSFLAGKGRIYLVGQRAYIMMVATPEQKNAQKFLNSFRLLNDRPSAPSPKPIPSPPLSLLTP